jgi:hypothetical protein
MLNTYTYTKMRSRARGSERENREGEYQGRIERESSEGE